MRDKFMSPGDVFIYNFGKQDGSLQGGKRPVIFCGNSKEGAFSSIAHVVPLTKVDKPFPLHFVLTKDVYPNLDYDREALCEQYQLIDKQKLGQLLFKLNIDDLCGIVKLCHKNLPF